MTSDTPWENQLAPSMLTPDTPAPRQRRKKAEDKPARQPRKAKEPVAEAPAKVRKPREPKLEKATTNTVRVDIKQYASMTCGLDANAFIKAHGVLAAVGKGARNKILSELQKVFC